MLSNLDAAAFDMWLVLSEYYRLVGVRKEIKCDYPTTICVDGTLFERWCLKTFCNLLFINKSWIPDDKIVSIVFGREPFPEKCGISFLYNIGERMGLSDHIKFLSLDIINYGPGGFIMEYRGLKLFGSWLLREDILQYLPEKFDEDGKTKNIRYHLGVLEYPELKIKLIFDWSGKYNNNKNKLIKHLRNANKL